MTEIISQYKHIIWDWNGTLLDDLDECLAVLNGMLGRRGMQNVNKERYRELLDFPVIEFYRAIGFDFDKEPYEIVADEYIAGYEQQWKKCRLHEGACEVLRVVKEAHITQSVLSAYQQGRLEEAIEYFGLSQWFVSLVGMNDYYAHSKINNGKQWLEESGHTKSDVLLVGDTAHDHEVAQAMGVDCVLMTYGHNSREKLSKLNVKLLDSLEELPDLLTGAEG